MHNKVKLFVLSFCVLTFTAVANSPCIKCLQNSHPYGIIASAVVLDELETQLKSEPPLSKTGKSLVTFNQFGFDVLDEKTMQSSWLVQDIIKFSQKGTLPILDVGGGYGRLTKLMLNNGATVIYNDLDTRHLLFGRQLITLEERQQLYLNTFHFPQGMIFKDNSLSGVVLHRVAHFMTGDQLEEGIAKIKRWLVPGGKVFIAVLPPQHGEYRDKVIAEYDKKWSQGAHWPGYGFKTKELLPGQAYALPKTLHVMDERPLKRVLEKYGFVIEKSGYIDNMKHFGNTKERDGHELFAIVARKA